MLLLVSIGIAVVICSVNGQYSQAGNRNYEYDDGSEQQQQYRPAPSAGYKQLSYQPSQPLQPQPAILMHKQALTHDGGFNYAFAADNGLKQGESIAPDGTRTGAYQYVDPNGKTISVKYTAGKDGFKILEGDHIPKPHPEIAQQVAPQPQYQPQAYQPQTYQPQPSYQPQYQPQRYSNAAQDDGQYRDAYEARAGPATFPSPQLTQANYYQKPKTAASPYYGASSPSGSYRASNALQQNEDNIDYNVEPGKPHSFGTGYSFEFGG